MSLFRSGLFFLLLFPSCGYQFGQGSSLARYQTLAIPYVEGDKQGKLTSALVRQVSCNGSLAYSRNGGALTLCVKIIEIDDHNIGYRYQQEKTGELRKNIVPVEARKTAVAEVRVLEASTGCVVLGPSRLSVSVDYDHDYYYSRDSINVFSLGQLTDVDTAKETAFHPLYTALAEKIVDYITSV